VILPLWNTYSFFTTYANIDKFVNLIKEFSIDTQFLIVTHNKKTMEALLKSGTLDDFVERNQGLANLDLILKFASSKNKMRDSGQTSLFGESTNVSMDSSLKLTDAPPVDKKQSLAWERELLGIYLKDHPLDEVKDLINKVAEPIGEVAKSSSNNKKIITTWSKSFNIN